MLKFLETACILVTVCTFVCVWVCVWEVPQPCWLHLLARVIRPHRVQGHSEYAEHENSDIKALSWAATHKESWERCFHLNLNQRLLPNKSSQRCERPDGHLAACCRVPSSLIWAVTDGKRDLSWLANCVLLTCAGAKTAPWSTPMRWQWQNSHTLRTLV